MKYSPIQEIKVGLNFGEETIPVGRLAIRDQVIYFEYHANYISTGLNISPVRLPFEPGLQSFNHRLFDGLPGVFNDSLPDGWGKLLLDRLLKSKNLLPQEFSPLDRLAYVGENGLGALIYEPDHSENSYTNEVDLDVLATQTQEVLEGTADDVLKELIELNGSSAGARPKALIGINSDHQTIIHGKGILPEGFEHWMVKFANTTDGLDAGAIEFVYALMAKDAGINMTDTHLFPAAKGAGYFATKRFDRKGEKRFHMHTASGLLHSNFRTPTLDYDELLTLTEALTQDVNEVEQMFRLAAFNIMAHNRDDHGKNFSFLMNDQGEWKLSPAYDLTFSSGPGGNQSTMVLGEGQNFNNDLLRKLGTNTSLDSSKVKSIIEQTRNALSQWESLASQHAITKTNIKLIKNRLLI